MNYIREATDYLKHYRELKKANENLENRLKQIKAELEGYKPIDYSGMPHGSGSAAPDDKICNLIFERDNLEKLLKENRLKVSEIEEVFNGLNDEFREVLKLAYIEEQPDVIICNKLGMSRSTYYRTRGKAQRSLAIQLFGIGAM